MFSESENVFGQSLWSTLGGGGWGFLETSGRGMEEK